MHPKMNKIHAYLEDGFEVREIDSDHGRVDVTLVREDFTVTLTLTREDAAAILWGGNRPPSHLVTLPLR